MSEKEVLDGSKLIAEFLGWTYFGHNDPRLTVNGVTYPAGWKRKATTTNRSKVDAMAYLCRRHQDLEYRWNWNYLMFAVEKIENLNLSEWMYKWEDERGVNYNFQNIEVEINHNQCYIDCNLELDPSFAINKVSREIKHGSKREATFSAVVEFIHWFNEAKAVY